MALKITSDCINCDICEPECPNEAISYDNKVQKTYVINPDLCTECIGFYDEPTCDKVCPIDCIIKDDERTESPEQLLAKYKQKEWYEADSFVFLPRSVHSELSMVRAL